MTIYLPENVKYIIRRLNEAGHEAYAVGGCVRDSLLNREPKDWDITTSALPEEVKSIFSRTIDTGIEHGTVTVMLDHTGYEVTTYRIDGKYSDSRHPDSVSFTRSLSEDLLRRDFTINAMAYGEEGLVDLFGGQEDLSNRIIRCVGDAMQRFDEDSLRILRALRFSAQLNFDIDPDTARAAGILAGKLVNVSAERIREELAKLLVSPHPDRLLKLTEYGIIPIILPELKPVLEGSTSASLMEKLQASPQSTFIRWALLLIPSGCAKEILLRLKYDNLTVNTVTKLERFADCPIPSKSAVEMRRLMNRFGAEDMSLLFDFRKALNPDTDFSAAEALCREITLRGDCTEISSLRINGNDLIALGVPVGRDIGRVLDYLLDRVIENPELNTSGNLRKLAKEMAKTNE